MKEDQLSDKDYMMLALDLAKKGNGYTSPNPMVGAVVVKNGQIIGTGYHQFFGGPHAEVYALDEAADNAKDATLYVTLEPCNHIGKTPPCTEKIINSGIRKVFVAMQDPNPNVKGGGIDALQNHGIEVSVGLCENQARQLNEYFIKYSQSGIPFVILKYAATLDGMLCTQTGDSKWITNARSREYVHQIRHSVDAIMVGIGTIQNDDPSLTTRLDNMESPKDPIRIILDTHLKISPMARILNLQSAAKTVIITGSEPSPQQKASLNKQGVEIFVSPRKNDRIDLSTLMRTLGSMGIMSVLIEGGGTVIASAFRERIVDKVLCFFGTKILGGNDGVSICQGPGPKKMSDALLLHQIKVHRFEDDVMIEGMIHSNG